MVAIVLTCTDPKRQLKVQVQKEQQATCSAFEETSVFLSGWQSEYGPSSMNIFFSVLQCLLPTDTGLITICKHTLAQTSVQALPLKQQQQQQNPLQNLLGTPESFIVHAYFPRALHSI